jgi:hypothetical protein
LGSINGRPAASFAVTDFVLHLPDLDSWRPPRS